MRCFSIPRFALSLSLLAVWYRERLRCFCGTDVLADDVGDRVALAEPDGVSDGQPDRHYDSQCLHHFFTDSNVDPKPILDQVDDAVSNAFHYAESLAVTDALGLRFAYTNPVKLVIGIV